MKDQGESPRRRPERSSTGNSDRRPAARQKKATPPEHTHAEAYYYVKQKHARTPMVFVLKDDEELRGTIEWYDHACLKVNRTEGPNVLLYKDCLKYVYKDPDEVEDDDQEPESD